MCCVRRRVVASATPGASASAAHTSSYDMDLERSSESFSSRSDDTSRNDTRRASRTCAKTGQPPEANLRFAPLIAPLARFAAFAAPLIHDDSRLHDEDVPAAEAHAVCGGRRPIRFLHHQRGSSDLISSKTSRRRAGGEPRRAAQRADFHPPRDARSIPCGTARQPGLSIPCLGRRA